MLGVVGVCVRAPVCLSTHGCRIEGIDCMAAFEAPKYKLVPTTSSLARGLGWVETRRRAQLPVNPHEPRYQLGWCLSPFQSPPPPLILCLSLPLSASL